jgi:hypothetical protein
MEPIRGTIRNGRVETEQPVNLPDGTEVRVTLADATPDDADNRWENSPEAIEAWIKQFDSLEQFLRCDERRRAYDAASRRFRHAT